jgi:citronellyl-CoA dehydrogenase
MLQFQEERLWGAASSLRSLDRLIDQTIDYTRQRKAFGKSILDNQVVHYRWPSCAPRSRRCAR